MLHPTPEVLILVIPDVVHDGDEEEFDEAGEEKSGDDGTAESTPQGIGDSNRNKTKNTRE